MGCSRSKSGTNTESNIDPSVMDVSCTLNAKGAHSASVIFLHGLGDTGNGWCENMGELEMDHVKFICPTASTIPVSLNHGFKMPAWFDIRGLGPSCPEDEAGIVKAASILNKLIDIEIAAGIPPNRIVIGGFSQGGATALYSGLTSDKDLAGIVALSTWLPLHDQFPGRCKSNKSTPILQCHGTSDPLIRIEWAKMTGELLKTMNSSHEFLEYSGVGHSFSEDEMVDLKRFLTTVIP
jgi:predicted esterase